jgi:hypothetical protein
VVDGAVVAAPVVVGTDRWAARRRALIPALIALTSVLGAVGAWRASAASSAAGSAERKAFADTVAVEQESARIETQIGIIESIYVRKVALEAMAGALRREAEQASPEDAARLTTQADAYQATAAAVFVDPDALRPDGSLDLQAKRDVEWALAGDRQDLDPAPEAAEAEEYRAKAQRLVGLTAFLIAAALFFTLAQVSRNPRVEILYWNGGAAVLVVSAGLLLAVEAL